MGIFRITIRKMSSHTVRAVYRAKAGAFARVSVYAAAARKRGSARPRTPLGVVGGLCGTVRVAGVCGPRGVASAPT